MEVRSRFPVSKLTMGTRSLVATYHQIFNYFGHNEIGSLFYNGNR